MTEQKSRRDARAGGADSPRGKGAAAGNNAKSDAQGMGIVALTQGQLVRRRFFRHRGALAGMILLGFIVLLAFTSLGFFGIPGWWQYSYDTTGNQLNGGKPTLDLVPGWIDGTPMAWGEHPFGQDDVGTDYFASTMRGAQKSILIALIVGSVGTMLGTLVGAVAGYFRGRIETVLMRFTDIVMTIPVLVIAAVIGNAIKGAGIVVMAVSLGCLVWTGLARMVRSEFLALREREFVEAARAMGAKSSRIILRHILPNTIGVIIVSATLSISAAILLETGLSYLGFGVKPPETSLGILISNAKDASDTRPWLFWWPGIFIVSIALAVNFIGDGLRDAFDPRQTRVRA